MPIQAQCSDCGKKYVVPLAMAGKRAKCKVCGNVFRIGGAATASKDRRKIGTKSATDSLLPTAPPPSPVSAAATDLGIAGAFTLPISAPLFSAAARLERRIQLLSWIQLRWWMLPIFFCCAIFIGLSANRWPGMCSISLWLFPTLGFVSVLLGAVYFGSRALIANNGEQISTGDLMLIHFQFAMIVLLRLRTFSHRRKILRSDQYRKFYRQMLGMILRALCLASLSAVVLAAKSASTSMPSLDGAQRAIQNFFDDSHRHRHRGGETDTP